MIKLYTSGHGVTTPLAEIVHAITNDKIEFTDTPENADVISALNGGKITTVIKSSGKVFAGENTVLPSKVRNEKQCLGDAVKKGYYILAGQAYGRKLPWGIITGIRPKKLVMDFYNVGALDEFKERFCVSDKKINLSLLTDKSQVTIKNELTEDSVCLYIGIPFCPTRCRYCSFVSMPMNKQERLIEPYVDQLIKEMEYTSRLLNNSGKKLEAVYIGGGTPTSLNEDLFDRMVSAAGNFFKSSSLKEFTVEAGRADTITKTKLKSALYAGMTRICINPQTMNDEILKDIGRNHSPEDFEEVFDLARRLGIKHINTDLIAGLPGETEEMFQKSFDRLINLKPDAITVHTMCIKRAADLKTAEFKSYDAEKMVDYASDKLVSSGYYPYYLYRQKDTLKALENTGFAKAGKESLYNIFMMEDIGSVIGLGAGSVTKIKTDGPNRFRRIFNFKNPVEYINGFDDIIKRKVDYNL